MIRSLLVAILLSLILAAAFPPPETSKTLNIYAIDVEGGKATLVVGPSGESMLIDSGWLGDGAQRDAARIMAAIEDAHLQQIDHLITTHWHRDHVGAMASLARQFPIREFIDHGPNVQHDPQVDAVLQSYSTLYSASKHSVVKPSDTIPIAGMDVRVVASAGELIQTPLPEGGSPNPYCAATKKPDAGKGENPQSIGVHVTFGQFRLLDLADLSAEKNSN
jgi:beta-lactamase superfamily II metal-dependent hydrolase